MLGPTGECQRFGATAPLRRACFSADSNPALSVNGDISGASSGCISIASFQLSASANAGSHWPGSGTCLAYRSHTGASKSHSKPPGSSMTHSTSSKSVSSGTTSKQSGGRVYLHVQSVPSAASGLVNATRLMANFHRHDRSTQSGTPGKHADTALAGAVVSVSAVMRTAPSRLSALLATSRIVVPIKSVSPPPPSTPSSSAPALPR
jgi:hypothetical protein